MRATLVLPLNREIDFDCACVCVACVRARAKLRGRDDSSVARARRTNLWVSVHLSVRPSGFRSRSKVGALRVLTDDS